MLNLTLAIRYSAQRQRPTAAWFVPGTSPAEWLAVLVSSPSLLPRLVLEPIAAGNVPDRLVGALVILPEENDGDAGRSVRFPGCFEYGVMAHRLFLPVEARLDPLVQQREVEILLAGNEDDFLFHPHLGLIRIERHERCRMEDLLEPPCVAPTDWNWAQVGPPPHRTLVSVESESLPSVDDVLEEARDDISTSDPKQIPRRRRHRDSESGPTHPIRAVGRWLGESLRSLGRKMRSGRSSHGQQGVQPPSRARGNRPVDRLLQLLDDDPDEGLRYAVALDGTPARGSAPAENRLIRRVVDFNLQRLLGVGPAGTWEVSQSRYELLRTKYRELAQRELSLKRYRRAAYVFAHLLGDKQTAAKVLMAGRHFREAAVLYRDCLHLPQSAAECLEQGQFWSEAIEVYRELQACEKVGDLCRTIGREAEAVEAYREAVKKSLQNDDYLQAARLTEQKLHATDESLRLLAAGWPQSKQAISCLEQMFVVLGAHQRHDEARKLIDMTDPTLLLELQARRVVDLLAKIASDYPDAEVKQQAADRVRVSAGSLLPQFTYQQRDELLGAVRRLVPGDRLLGRDCHRYQSLRRCGGVTAQRSEKATRSRAALQLVWSFNLPGEVDWIAAASSQLGAFAAGYSEQSLTVAHLPFSPSIAERTVMSVPVAPNLAGAPIILCPDPMERSQLLIHVLGAGREMLIADQLASDDLPLIRPLGNEDMLTAATCGLARSPDGLTWVFDRDPEELQLRCYSQDGNLVGVHHVPFFDRAAHRVSAGQLIPVTATGGFLYVAVGACVVCIQRGVRTEVIELPSPVVQFILPPGAYPDHMLVQCQHELIALWHSSRGIRQEQFSDSTEFSIGGCAGDGTVVLSDGRRYELYVRSAEQYQLKASSTRRYERLLAILPTRQPGQIITLCRAGEVELLSLR